MLVVAGTSVFFVVQRDRPPGGLDSPARHDETRDAPHGRGGGKIRPASYERPRAAYRGTPAADASAASRSNPRRGPARETKSGLREGLKVEAPANHPRREELRRHARAVEAYAKRRLAVMTEQLDLTGEQQEKIFPLLVRASRSYDPGMRVVSGSHASPLPVAEVPATTPLDRSSEQELVQKELDAWQEDELIERRIGDLLIWEEIIGDLARQLDTATPGEIVEAAPEPEPERATTGGGMSPDPAVTPPASGGETTDPPDSRGGRNLFDEVEPGN